jgi:hypothetical protein
MKISVALLVPVIAFGVACGDDDAPADGGSCALDVTLGQSRGGVFEPLAEGDPVELVLGFQGFRMLDLALVSEGTHGDELELSTVVIVESSGVELAQRTRERGFRRTESGVVLDEYLVFFNDEPSSALVGREAEVELVVRSGACVGGTSVRVMVRDDDPCVDTTIVVDAGEVDAGLGDAAVCEAVP